MYQNRLKEIDELKSKIDAFRPLPKDVLKQIQEYLRLVLPIHQML